VQHHHLPNIQLANPDNHANINTFHTRPNENDYSPGHATGNTDGSNEGVPYPPRSPEVQTYYRNRNIPEPPAQRQRFEEYDSDGGNITEEMALCIAEDLKRKALGKQKIWQVSSSNRQKYTFNFTKANAFLECQIQSSFLGSYPVA
jgi:hypothetical protein